MPYLQSLADKPTLLDVFQRFPKLWKPMIEYHQVLLRGPSQFSVAERELIAAVVSFENSCRYCHGIHSSTAIRFGVAEQLLGEVTRDIATSNVSDRMKPVLQYAKKLTASPSSVSQDDVDRMTEQGWDDTAIHDVASICALFNFMNRMVEGLGIEADDQYYELSSARLHAGGYAGLLTLLTE